MRRFTLVNVAIAVAMASPAFAADGMGPPAAAKMASGTSNGLSWTAASRIIGQTPTSNVGPPPSNTIGGGNPIYKPSADKSGTVA